jgi:Fuc2NAc and GlcNAc transferase
MMGYHHQAAILFEWLFFFSFIFLLSWGLTWCITKIALRHCLLDIPNQRSSHSCPTPRGGGVAILLTTYLGGAYLVFTGKVAVPYLLVLSGCGLGIAIIGLLDDLFHLSAFGRIIVHFGCALLAVQFLPVGNDISLPFGEGIFSVVKLIFVAVGIVWFINLYNFMDGIDGLAGVEAISVALDGMLLLLCSGETRDCFFLLLILAAAVMGFLMLNWPPARIFMGDACSGFLGFFFAIMALLTAQTTELSPWTWLILLGVFVMDSSVTLLARISRGEKFYEAHRSHAYQILARRLHSHKKVTLGVLAVNVLWLLPWAFCSISWPEYGWFFTFFSYIPLTMVCLMIGAGKKND